MYSMPTKNNTYATAAKDSSDNVLVDGRTNSNALYLHILRAYSGWKESCKHNSVLLQQLHHIDPTSISSRVKTHRIALQLNGAVEAGVLQYRSLLYPLNDWSRTSTSTLTPNEHHSSVNGQNPSSWLSSIQMLPVFKRKLSHFDTVLERWDIQGFRTLDVGLCDCISISFHSEFLNRI